MTKARYKAAGVSVNDHQFLVTGGEDRGAADAREATNSNGPVLKSCEYFDLRTNSCRNLPVGLPHPLIGHGIVFVGSTSVV